MNAEDQSINGHRSQYIAGLHAFAEFLTLNPEYPPTREHYVLADDDAAGEAELRRLAAILGADVRPPDRATGHWLASRAFAGLSVTICYSSRAAMADYDALISYRENVHAEAVSA